MFGHAGPHLAGDGAPARRSACPRNTLSQHVVQKRQQVRLYFQAEGFRDTQIDGQLMFDRRLHRKVARLFALQKAIDIRRRTAQDVGQVGTVANETGIKAMGVSCRQTMPGGKRSDLFVPRPGFYSTTESARASRVGDTSTSSAFAVLRLITSSNLVGCSTGRSAGLAPARIFPT